MKNIYKYIACAFALTAALSCSELNQTPVFEDSKSFVAFGQTSYSVSEDAGTLSIPVTLASPDAKKVTVAYSVADSTAKEGVNFALVDESAVLVYDGTSYVQNIEIDITNISTTAEQSGYTGDLVFTVTLESAGDLDLGHNSTCTVKIVDLDHPLAAILGDYKVSAQYYTGSPAEWTLSFTNDPDDVTVVWIDYPVYLTSLASTWGGWSVYGNVSEDLKTITIPCGQTCGVNSEEPAWYSDLSDTFTFGTWVDLGGGSVNLSDSGVVTFTMGADGVWKTEDAPAVWTPSGSYLAAQGVMTKGTMTLTKL